MPACWPRSPPRPAGTAAPPIWSSARRRGPTPRSPSAPGCRPPTISPGCAASRSPTKAPSSLGGCVPRCPQQTRATAGCAPRLRPASSCRGCCAGTPAQASPWQGSCPGVATRVTSSPRAPGRSIPIRGRPNRRGSSPSASTTAPGSSSDVTTSGLPHIADAVQASSAVPGLYAPVTLDGVDHVDGGVHSPTNADLTVGLGYDVVVVSSPMSAQDASLLGGTATRWWHHRLAEREATAARVGATRVLLVEPTTARSTPSTPVTDQTSPPPPLAAPSRSSPTPRTPRRPTASPADRSVVVPGTGWPLPGRGSCLAPSNRRLGAPWRPTPDPPPVRVRAWHRFAAAGSGLVPGTVGSASRGAVVADA